MRILQLVIFAFALLLGEMSVAETRAKLASSGSWTLYRIDGFMVAIGDKKHVEINGACVAEVESGTVRFNFATLSPEANSDQGQSSGIVIGQVVSPSWKFRTREDTLRLSTEGFNTNIAGSLYDDDMIMFNMGGYGIHPAILEVFSWYATGMIEIVDSGGKTIAQFPSKGLKAIYRKMLQCGGLTPSG